MTEGNQRSVYTPRGGTRDSVHDPSGTRDSVHDPSGTRDSVHDPSGTQAALERRAEAWRPVGVTDHITGCYERLQLLARNLRVVCDANLRLHVPGHKRSHVLSIHSFYKDDCGWGVIFQILEPRGGRLERLDLDRYVERYLPVLHETPMSDMEMLQHFSIHDGLPRKYHPRGYSLNQLLLFLSEASTAQDWSDAWTVMKEARILKNLVMNTRSSRVQMIEIAAESQVSVARKRRKRTVRMIDDRDISGELLGVYLDKFCRGIDPSPARGEECILCFEDESDFNWICEFGDHVICYSCMRLFVDLQCKEFCRQVGSEVLVADFVLKCPILGCESVINVEDQILIGVYEQVRDRIVGLKVRAGVLVPRPCPNCAGITYLSRTLETGAERMVECRFCLAKYCTGCGEKSSVDNVISVRRLRVNRHLKCTRWWHEKIVSVPKRHSADDFFLNQEEGGAENVDLFSQHLYQLMRECTFRECPECHRSNIQREDECTHMTDLCGRTFCYVCSRQLFDSKRDYITYAARDPTSVAYVDSSHFQNPSDDKLSLLAHNWCSDEASKSRMQDPEFIGDFFYRLARRDSGLLCPMWLKNIMQTYLGSEIVRTEQDATKHFHNCLFYERFMFLVDEKLSQRSLEQKRKLYQEALNAMAHAEQFEYLHSFLDIAWKKIINA
jgi:hypothetical protein